MREKIAKYIPTDCDSCWFRDCGRREESEPCNLQHHQADEILEVVSQEIKKVENPYKEAERIDFTPTQDGFKETYQIDMRAIEIFEQCRQKILDLLNGI